MKRLNYQEEISDDMQDIISYKPKWFVRNSNYLLLTMLVFIFAATWFIKFPSVTKASARLVSLKPQLPVISKVNGKLIKLFVNNEDKVQKEQIIAFIESSGNHEEIISLHKWIVTSLDSLKQSDIGILINTESPKYYHLGEVQTYYQDFQNQLELTKQVYGNGYFQIKKSILQKDLNLLSKIKISSEHQKVLIKNDIYLDSTELIVYEKLAKEKVIAPIELNQYKSKLYNTKQKLEQANAQVSNIDLGKQGKYQELIDISKQITDLKQSFISTLINLKIQVELWLQKYVIKAHEYGRINFYSNISVNEFVNKDQVLFYILPEQTDFYAELYSGQSGFGKIELSQKIILRLEGYPSSDFGFLEGRVSYISSVPNANDSFMIKGELVNGLVTNLKRRVYFRNDLVAKADIISEDSRLISKIISHLFSKK